MSRTLSLNQLAYCQTMARRLITARRRRRDDQFHIIWQRVAADPRLAQGTAWMITLAIIDVPYGTPYSTPAGHRTLQLSSALERPGRPATGAITTGPASAPAVAAAEALVAAAAQVLSAGSTRSWATAWDAFTVPTRTSPTVTVPTVTVAMLTAAMLTAPLLTDVPIAALAEIAIRLWTVRHGTRRRRAARHARRAVHLAYCRPWRRRLSLTRRHIGFLCRPRVPYTPWAAPRVRLRPQVRPIPVPAFPAFPTTPPHPRP